MDVDRVAVVVESRDPLLLAEFWARLFERRLTADTPVGRHVIDVGGRTDLRFLPAVEPHRGANRQHIDLASESLAHQARLVERALGLGARHVDIGQGDVPWTVMIDPEDNEFCVLEPRDEYRSSGPFAALVTHAGDPLTVGRFWSGLVGAPMILTHPECTSVRYGDTADPALEFVRHSNPPGGRGRLHVQLRAIGSTHPMAGADAAQPCPVCREPSAVLIDPEQNHLCVCVDSAPAEKPMDARVSAR